MRPLPPALCAPGSTFRQVIELLNLFNALHKAWPCWHLLYYLFLLLCAIAASYSWISLDVAQRIPRIPWSVRATCCAFVATPWNSSVGRKGNWILKIHFAEWMQQFIHFEISLQLVYWFAGGCVRKDYTNASVVLRNILMHSLLVREDLMMFISHVPIKFKCPIVGTNSQKGFSLALFNNTRIISFSVSFFFFKNLSYFMAAYFSCHKVRHLSRLKCLLSIRIVRRTQDTWALFYD